MAHDVIKVSNCIYIFHPIRKRKKYGILNITTPTESDIKDIIHLLFWGSEEPFRTQKKSIITNDIVVIYTDQESNNN